MINRIKLAVAVLFARRSVVIIDKGETAVQYTQGLEDNGVAELKSLDFVE
jgi:hypothetical protein